MQASLSPQVLPSVALAVIAEAFEAHSPELASEALALLEEQPEALAVVAEAFDAHSPELAREALALLDEHPEALAVVTEALEAHSEEPALAVMTLALPSQEPSAFILA
jgi:hypothetical protein